MILKLSKKSCFQVLIFILMISSCFSQTNQIDSIWESYIQSFGNPLKVKELKTLYYESITTSVNGISEEKVTLKYPDKIKYELKRPNGMIETILINGKNGIKVIDNDTSVLDSNTFCNFKYSGLIFSEIYFKELGFKFSQVYFENDDGRINILVENDCLDIVYVFDGETSKLLETNPVKYDMRILVKEIKTIEGLKFITKTKLISDNLSSTTINQNFKLNLEVPDTTFKIKR